MNRRMTLLARVIKGYLDLCCFVLLIARGVLLVATPFVIVGAPEIDDSDIRVAVRFTVGESALAGSSPRSDDVVPVLVRGQGDLRVRSASRLSTRSSMRFP